MVAPKFPILPLEAAVEIIIVGEVDEDVCAIHENHREFIEANFFQTLAYELQTRPSIEEGTYKCSREPFGKGLDFFIGESYAG